MITKTNFSVKTIKQNKRQTKIKMRCTQEIHIFCVRNIRKQNKNNRMHVFIAFTISSLYFLSFSRQAMESVSVKKISRFIVIIVIIITKFSCLDRTHKKALKHHSKKLQNFHLNKDFHSTH